jgi:hypothetical protein
VAISRECSNGGTKHPGCFKVKIVFSQSQSSTLRVTLLGVKLDPIYSYNSFREPIPKIKPPTDFISNLTYSDFTFQFVFLEPHFMETGKVAQLWSTIDCNLTRNPISWCLTALGIIYILDLLLSNRLSNLGLPKVSRNSRIHELLLALIEVIFVSLDHSHQLFQSPFIKVNVVTYIA